MNINIDYSRDNLLDKYAISILKDRYMIEGEESPQEAFARASIAFADDEAHAQRLYDYVSNLWFMYATPILANGGTKRGLPISCFLNYVDDSRNGILEHYKENGWLASSGGGLGGYWGSLRTSGAKTSSGGESTGMIPFLKVVDDITLAFRQGGTRRAAYAAYLDISHPEIIEFLNIRKATGGDVNRKCLNLHHGINVTDDFMGLIYRCATDPDFDCDDWPLIDPHNGNITEVVSAKSLWQSILELRIQTGEPYLHFVDRSNELLPEPQKRMGLKVHGSNLCSEIVLPTNTKRTAVCCLSSVNLAKYDEWKYSTMVQDIIRMLDNVLTAFIEMPHIQNVAKEAMKKAVNSATRERSLGLGAMGFHAYLQSKMIPFESDKASEINKDMFNYIRKEAEMASIQLGVEKGYPSDFEGYDGVKRRNMHLMAIAPNASSSIICGNTSPCIEPFSGNTYAQKTENGTNVVKNKYLAALMEAKGFSVAEKEKLWKNINSHNGSIQHLKEFTDEEKAVFKTAFEIDQTWVIQHASDRQEFIDQAQSVNLFFKNPVELNEVHNLHLSAWKSGLKTLYYCRSMKSNRTENIGLRFDRHQIKKSTVMPDGSEISCVGCEG